MHPETTARAVRYGAGLCVDLVNAAVAKDPGKALSTTREFQARINIPGTNDAVVVLVRIEPKP